MQVNFSYNTLQKLRMDLDIENSIDKGDDSRKRLKTNLHSNSRFQHYTCILNKLLDSIVVLDLTVNTKRKRKKAQKNAFTIPYKTL